jgi:ubiquinone/menaquinone biosynthesis C-methylase UbiE
MLHRRIALVLAFLLTLSPVTRAEERDEAARLAELLALKPGATVADIGAGEGELAFALAKTVGSSGRVYATELDAEKLAELREKAASVSNVTIVEAQVAATGLPDACCDAIYMRDVYHHLTDPAALNRDIARSLRPGGTYVVIDFRPGGLLRLFKVEGVSETRKGHGISPENAEKELADAGFARVKLVDPWLDRLLGPDLWALALRERATQSDSAAPPGSP